MSVAEAALKSLNLSSLDLAELLDLNVEVINTFTRGECGPDLAAALVAKLRDLSFAKMGVVNNLIDQANDREDSGNASPLEVRVADVPLRHKALREAAVAQALLVIGAEYMTVIDESSLH